MSDTYYNNTKGYKYTARCHNCENSSRHQFQKRKLYCKRKKKTVNDNDTCIDGQALYGMSEFALQCLNIHDNERKVHE